MKRTRFLRQLLLGLGLSVTGGACGSDSASEPAPQVIGDLSISLVGPQALIPGSQLVVEGTFGDVTVPLVEISGQFNNHSAKLLLPAKLSAGRMIVDWPGGIAAGLKADSGILEGRLRVLATGPVDGLSHVSSPVDVKLDIKTALVPRLFGVFEGVVFVNNEMEIDGDDFLLGGDEGQTVAIVEGCFAKQGQGSCTPISDVELPVAPAAPLSRTKGVFPLAPKVVGIEPGSFKGTVRLRNDPKSGAASVETKQIPVDLTLIRPQIFSFSPTHASLGQYVDIKGGGFVGPSSGVEDKTTMLNTVELVGQFHVIGAPAPTPVAVTLVPEFFNGRLVRYVMNEADELGKLADLRKVVGSFKGKAIATTRYGAVEVTSEPATVELGIAPVKQVIYVEFLPSYVKSLRHLGLRTVEKKIRERILQVLRRDYAGLNVDVRDKKPEDFAHFAWVEISGKDPNGLGLLGYDNTHGKDIGNLRLFDRIGGVNALTLENGYPGYGGVFIESLFGFSQHPGAFGEKLEVADPLFDQHFDPFRPDRKGKPVLAADLAGLDIPTLQNAEGCPAPSSDRGKQIACAVWVLGSLIGTTTSHEVAHSMGLADPKGTAFHNFGDEPNRLMDGGASRTFAERAELQGQGPAVFCKENYAYMRGIVPSVDPDPLASRPACD